MTRINSRSDDDDDEPKPPKKRGRNNNDDDDEIDRSSVRRPVRAQGGSGLAITSMVLGLAALAIFVIGGCCLGSITAGITSFVACPLAGIFAAVSIVLGFMGNTPGNGGFAWTGIICSFVVLGFLLLSLILFLIFGLAMIGVAGAGAQGR